MKRQTVLLALALIAIVGTVAGTKYSRCQLATLLLKHGISRSQINNWVCLIMSESGGNTAVRGPRNSDGSYDYGLFQINSRYWCGINGKGGDCNVACSQLLDNNVADDIACAKLIYNRQGFPAWYGWRSKCKNPPAVKAC